LRQIPLRLSVVAIAVFFAAMHLLVLPPDGFVTGDQGSKFLQARAFAQHGPLDPSIDVLARDIDPDLRRQEPKLKNRRGRLVSEFLWLLPWLSAPFYRALGMQGLYVVPGLAVIVIFLAAAALAGALDDEQPLRTAWLVLLVTPVAAYGLELWEHAPAAACVLVAALAFVPRARPPSRAALIGAGAAIALGTLFREEVVAALPALVAARALARERDRLGDGLRAAAWASAGAGLVFLASMPMNLLIYGAPLPMHVTQDAWEVAKNSPYLQVRRDIVVDLLLPASHTLICALALGAGIIGARLRRLEAVHLAAAAVLTIVVFLPLWRLASGVQPTLSYRISSAAHTWTFALALLYAPWIAGSASHALRFLVGSGVFLFAGVALLVPTSGGSQWSPRFMLAVAPLLALAACRALPAAPRRMVTVIFAASIVMQMTGIAFVGRSKMRHAAMTHEVAARTPEGGVLISNVYWFPEVTATLGSSRRFLFSWSAADVPELAAMARARGFSRFELVTSAPLTGFEAPPRIGGFDATCVFERGEQVALDRLGLTMTRYECGAAIRP
jgi:hypothetical protein